MEAMLARFRNIPQSCPYKRKVKIRLQVTSLYLPLTLDLKFWVVIADGRSLEMSAYWRWVFIGDGHSLEMIRDGCLLVMGGDW